MLLYHKSCDLKSESIYNVLFEWTQPGSFASIFNSRVQFSIASISIAWNMMSTMFYSEWKNSANAFILSVGIQWICTEQANSEGSTLLTCPATTACGWVRRLMLSWYLWIHLQDTLCYITYRTSIFTHLFLLMCIYKQGTKQCWVVMAIKNVIKSQKYL